jgi:hypothetical protein
MKLAYPSRAGLVAVPYGPGAAVALHERDRRRFDQFTVGLLALEIARPPVALLVWPSWGRRRRAAHGPSGRQAGCERKGPSAATPAPSRCRSRSRSRAARDARLGRLDGNAGTPRAHARTHRPASSHGSRSSVSSWRRWVELELGLGFRIGRPPPRPVQPLADEAADDVVLELVDGGRRSCSSVSRTRAKRAGSVVATARSLSSRSAPATLQRPAACGG